MSSKKIENFVVRVPLDRRTARIFDGTHFIKAPPSPEIVLVAVRRRDLEALLERFPDAEPIDPSPPPPVIENFELVEGFNQGVGDFENVVGLVVGDERSVTFFQGKLDTRDDPEDAI